MSDLERFPALGLGIASPEEREAPEFDLCRDFGAAGDGAADDAPALTRLAAAVNAGRVPSGAVVRIPAGTYRVRGDETIGFRRAVVLRGEGTANTMLVLEYEAQGSVFLSAAGDGMYLRHTSGAYRMRLPEGVDTYPGADFSAVVRTPQRGDRAVSVARPTLFSPGDHAYLLCDDYGGVVEYAAGERRAEHFLLKQLLRVTAVDGSEVEFDTPLRHDFAGAAPRLYRWGPLAGFGIEHLTIEDRSAIPESEALTTFRGIQFDGVVNGWVWDVHFRDSTSIPLSVERSSRIIVREALFDGARHVGAGGNGYLPRLMLTDDSLVEHCTSVGGRHALICDWSCWGNVLRYNRVVATPNVEMHGEYSTENLYLRNDVRGGRMEIGGGWVFHGHDGPRNELRENYARRIGVLKACGRENRVVGNWYVDEIIDRGADTLKEGNQKVPDGWDEFPFADLCGHEHRRAAESGRPG